MSDLKPCACEEEATDFWSLCQACRDNIQNQADLETVRLHGCGDNAFNPKRRPDDE